MTTHVLLPSTLSTSHTPVRPFSVDVFKTPKQKLHTASNGQSRVPVPTRQIKQKDRTSPFRIYNHEVMNLFSAFLASTTYDVVGYVLVFSGPRVPIAHLRRVVALLSFRGWSVDEPEPQGGASIDARHPTSAIGRTSVSFSCLVAKDQSSRSICKTERANVAVHWISKNFPSRTASFSSYRLTRLRSCRSVSAIPTSSPCK